MKRFKGVCFQGFDQPTQLPRTQEQAGSWQEANVLFWQDHPMCYDWKLSIAQEAFSKEYFGEIDKRFFCEVAKFMPTKKLPFDYLVDFSGLADKDVLEIGVGAGSHAHLLALHSKSFTGIDITDKAVEITSKRMEAFGVSALIKKMDAEAMEFDSNSFDFIWSWGVIHHSSDTRKVLEEMHRVLRPSGSAITMVYHRNWWNYWAVTGLIRGVLLGQLLRRGSLHHILQQHTDGALARFYTIAEWRELLSGYFLVDDILIFGGKAEVFPIPNGRLKNTVMALVPDSLSRVLTNRLHMGNFLVSKFRKQPISGTQ